MAVAIPEYVVVPVAEVPAPLMCWGAPCRFSSVSSTVSHCWVISRGGVDDDLLS